MLFRSRRSVAPVIATLLMVAIAVVGGMLVFVFAQDFFTQTDSMTGPTIEQVQMYGYDARDLITATNIENHEGIACAATGTVSGGLAEADVFALYVRNLGNQPVVINEVNVFGTGAVPDTQTTLTAATLIAGEFTVLIADTCVTTTAASPNLAILAGADATILVAFDESTMNPTDPVKVGRPIFVSIETAGGNIFTKNIISGRSVG